MRSVHIGVHNVYGSRKETVLKSPSPCFNFQIQISDCLSTQINCALELPNKLEILNNMLQNLLNERKKL